MPERLAARRDYSGLFNWFVLEVVEYSVGCFTDIPSDETADYGASYEVKDHDYFLFMSKRRPKMSNSIAANVAVMIELVLIPP